MAGSHFTGPVYSTNGFVGAVYSTDQTNIMAPQFGAVGNGVADDTAALNSALTAASTAGKMLYIPTNITIRVSADFSVPDGVTVYGGGTIQSGTTASPSHSFLFIGDSSKVTGMQLKNITVLSYYNKNNWEVTDNTFGSVLSSNPISNATLVDDVGASSYTAVTVTNYSGSPLYQTATKYQTCPTGFKITGNKLGADGYSSYPIGLANIVAGTNADITDNKFFARQKITDATVTNSDGSVTIDPETPFAGLTLHSSSIINMNYTSVLDSTGRGIGLIWDSTWQAEKSASGTSYVGAVLINSANNYYYRVTGKATSVGTLSGSTLASNSSYTGNINLSATPSATMSSTGYIMIDNEIMAYNAQSGTSITIAVRGMNFTTAATHSSGATVYFVELGASGSLGALAPTHTSGTALNGELMLTCDGTYSSTAPYTYKLCDLAAGSGLQRGFEGSTIALSLADMNSGQYYRVVSLGDFASIVANQVNWNTAGGTTNKKYSVGSVFQAVNTLNFDGGAQVRPVYVFNTASTIYTTPDIGGGIACTGLSDSRIKNNTFHGGRVGLGIDSTLKYAFYYFPMVDNTIEDNELAYSNQETLSFDSITSPIGATFLTTTIAPIVAGTLQTTYTNLVTDQIAVSDMSKFPYSGTIQIGSDTVNYWAISGGKLMLSGWLGHNHSIGENVTLLTQGGWYSNITLTDDASPVTYGSGAYSGITVSPVGRVLKFNTGALAGQSYKITAVNGTTVTLGDDWGTNFHISQHIATAGDVVSIEYDVRRNKVINNTIINGNIAVWGVGSDMQITGNNILHPKWMSYAGSGHGIFVVSMMGSAAKSSSYLGAASSYVTPCNLTISENIIKGDTGIAIYAFNETGSGANCAQMWDVTLTNNIGGNCIVGPLSNFVCNGNNFSGYTVGTNPKGSYGLSSVSIVNTTYQFSCSSSTLVVGQTVVIAGTFGGTGSITGYANSTTYYIIATNGTTGFNLSATSGGSAVSATTGTTTGVSFTVNDLSSQTYGSEHAVLTKNTVMKAGTPIATGTKPTSIQQAYINTSTGIFYIAKGTNYGDFVQIN